MENHIVMLVTALALALALILALNICGRQAIEPEDPDEVCEDMQAW